MQTMTDVKALRKQSEDLDFESKRLRAEARGIFSKADDEKRGLTDEESTRLDAIESRQGAIERQTTLIDGEISDAEKAARSATARPAVTVRESALDDPMRGFYSSADFFSSIISAGRGRAIDSRLRPLQIGAAPGSDEQQYTDSGFGGAWVPRVMMSQLLEITPEMDPTAGLVTTIPMAGSRVDIPARVDADHSNSVSGGFTVARRAETAAITSSRIGTDVVALDAKSQAGLVYATEEILSDSVISFIAVINQSAAQEFASANLREKLTGNGTTQMLGVVGAATTIDYTATSGAGAINGADLVGMRSVCWGYGQAIWLANHTVLPVLAGAFLAGTNSDFPVFVPGNGTDVPDTLLGRPIYFSEYPSAVNTSGDLILGNWSQYLQGEYEGIRADESMHVRFVENERAFRFVRRNDGKPWWLSTLTPINGTAMAPFVTLSTRV